MSKSRTKKSIPPEVLERAASALRVLAHPARLRIVELLADRDLSVGALAEVLEMPQAACSQHLNLMRAHGLLRCRRDGKSAYYDVVDPSALNLLECIRKHET